MTKFTNFEIILLLLCMCIAMCMFFLYLKHMTLRYEFITFSDRIANSIETLQEDAEWSIKNKAKQILVMNGYHENEITDEQLDAYVMTSIKNAKEEWGMAVDNLASNLKRNGLKPLTANDKLWVLSNFYK